MQLVLGKFQLSAWRIHIYLAEARSFLLERLSSTLEATIIFRPDDLIIPAWEKC